MKNKKFLGIFALVLSLCLALTTFSFIGAKADEAGETEPVTASKTVIAAMKYSVTDFGGADGNVFGAVQYLEGEEYKDAALGEEKTSEADYWLSTDKKDITFSLNRAEYKVTVLKNNDEDAKVERIVNVTVKEKTDVEPALVLDSDKLKEVKNKIDEVNVNDDKKFELPDTVWNLLADGYEYPLNKVTAKVYVKNPSSGWSSSYSTSGKKTSTLRISVSDKGTYSFYVLFSISSYDPATGDSKELVMKKDSEWVEYDDGFYAVTKNEDGTETKELKLPVFSFNYTHGDAVIITQKKSSSSAQVVGSACSALSFTLENSLVAKCTLYYSAEGTDNWVKVTNENQAKFDEDVFGNYTSGTSLTFTPLKKGSFKVECQARGADDEKAATKESDVITIKRETVIRKAENTAVRDFFKNNWKACIFLGIALICLIAIIVIALWKPKDDKKVAVEDVKAAKKVENKPEVIEAEDKVEEAPEAKAEEVEEPAEDEAPAEDAAEAEEANAETVEEAPAAEEAAEVAPESAEVAPEVVKVEEAPEVKEEAPAAEDKGEEVKPEEPKAE